LAICILSHAQYQWVDGIYIKRCCATCFHFGNRDTNVCDCSVACEVCDDWELDDAGFYAGRYHQYERSGYTG
jgi:hypothetical protein